jgi:hypothetical protein
MTTTALVIESVSPGQPLQQLPVDSGDDAADVVCLRLALFHFHNIEGDLVAFLQAFCTHPAGSSCSGRIHLDRRPARETHSLLRY